MLPEAPGNKWSALATTLALVHGERSWDTATGVVCVSREAVGCGRYDNVAARIIPRVTSKITTQIIMNIIFCKTKERHEFVVHQRKVISSVPA